MRDFTKHRTAFYSTFLLLFLLLNFGCSKRDTSQAEQPYREITVAEVRERLEGGDDLVILDVRTIEEYESATGHLTDAILIPVQELEQRYHELESVKDKEIVAYCRSGRRSERASLFLAGKGFKVYNMLGGILEWNKMKAEMERK